RSSMVTYGVKAPDISFKPFSHGGTEARGKPENLIRSGLTPKPLTFSVPSCLRETSAFILQLARFRVQPLFAGVVVPAGIDAPGDVAHFAGGGVDPLEGAVVRGGADALAEPGQVAAGKGDDAALAAPAVGGVVGLPPGIVGREHGAVPAAVHGARVDAVAVLVHPVRAVFEHVRVGHLLVAAGLVGGADVGVVDDAGAPAP